MFLTGASRLAAVSALLIVSLCCQSQTVSVNLDNQVGTVPVHYGFEGTWIDQDSSMFLQRYRTSNLNILRMQFPMFEFEPANDNSNPENSVINFDFVSQADVAYGKTTSFHRWFVAMRRQHPDLVFYLNIWDCANWLASTPNTFMLGASGAWPPTNYAEYSEIVRASLSWLVNDVGVPPSRVMFTFVNEPNSDPSFPTHAFEGDLNDLLAMAAAARAAADEVSPEIRMGGIEEVFQANLTRQFLNAGGDQYVDFLAFHVYQIGASAINGMITSIHDDLVGYNLPLYLSEMGDNDYGAGFLINYDSEEAGIALTRNLVRIWELDLAGMVMFRFSNLYLNSPSLPLSGWTGYGLFEDWRGTNTNGEAYKLFPGFWAFANFYNHFTNGVIVQSAESINRMEVLAVRGDSSLAIAAVNYSTSSRTLDFQLSGGADFSRARVVDGLSAIVPFDSLSVSGGNFTYSVPGNSVRIFLLGEGSSLTGLGDNDPVESGLAVDFQFSLYPNPVNATATIEYALQKAQKLSVVVMDIQGRVLETLFRGNQDAGSHSMRLDGEGLASGIYFVRIAGESFAKTQKLVLIK
ncbi:MAG TPA: T9SS type A sorting domain-containing protein [Calditrichia bacterium]|nr:T9SS type A sorting domain-containing protein [Calditrichota bacterium]HQU71353.1 T9SS type A sorting domain-containing protein [Calditrichia bacterium]HQV31468.1 T9SS type A sorting domain-containing protein [Calditrichia bacterium]